MPEVVIDDFEDGDITISATDWSGWNGDTGSFSASSSSPIAGSFSGLLTSSNQNNAVDALRTAGTTESLSATVNIDSSYVDPNDGFTIRVLSGATPICEVLFEEQATFEVDAIGSSRTNIGTWGTGTDYVVTFDFRPSSNEFFVEYDGSYNGPFSTANAFATVDTLEFENDTDTFGNSTDVLIDTVLQQPQLATPSLSVDATRDAEIDVSIASFPAGSDGFDLYRTETPPVTTGDTLVASPTSPTTTVTDTGLENGERYYYGAIATDSTGGRSDSELGTADGITTLPAPTIDSSEDTA